MNRRRVSQSAAVRKQHVSTRSVAIRNRRIRRVGVVCAVLAVFALAYVWTRVQVIQLGYEVSRLRKNIEELKLKKTELEAEITALKTPERLEKVAKEYFHMKQPGGSEIVFVDP